MLKTYEAWKGSLSEYLQIGDEVDQEMVDHFIDVLPPACLSGKCIQIGEPYSHRDDPKTGNWRATYPTLKSEGFGEIRKWFWAGHCFKGETVQPE